jgi:hypothetical protein
MSVSIIGRTAIAVCVFGMNAWAGYTHHFIWRQDPDPGVLHECVVDMSRIIAARWSTLAGPEGQGKPEINSLDLVFNGIGDQGHEPFVFPGRLDRIPGFPGPKGFNFCKTAAKPYDAVVTACLLVARDHFPPSVLAISSDGAWNQGAWGTGANLYLSVLGRTPKDPTGGEKVDDFAKKLPAKDAPPHISGTAFIVGAALLLLLWFAWKG